MLLSRRAAWFLVAFAVWNAYVWVTFVVNVYPQHGFDRFFLVHAVIGGVTLALGLVVGGIGLRAVRARRRHPEKPAYAGPARGDSALPS
ncbi:MAG: SCO4848 family membrane protein [Candidatus Dormibacteria bacterium]